MCPKATPLLSPQVKCIRPSVPPIEFEVREWIFLVHPPQNFFVHCQSVFHWLFHQPSFMFPLLPAQHLSPLTHLWRGSATTNYQGLVTICCSVLHCVPFTMLMLNFPVLTLLVVSNDQLSAWMKYIWEAFFQELGTVKYWLLVLGVFLKYI